MLFEVSLAPVTMNDHHALGCYLAIALKQAVSIGVGWAHHSYFFTDSSA